MMVSSARYYPKGYIGTDQAAVLIAGLRNQKNWRTQNMLPGESDIWERLGSSLNAEFIDYHLFCLQRKLLATDPNVDVSSMFLRYIDFDHAIQELRTNLHAGELTAQFCDGHGQFHSIQNDGWGGNDGWEILLRGVVQMQDGFTRLVLLSREAICRLAQSAPEGTRRATRAGGPSSPQSTQAPASALRKAEEIFREWRAAELEAGRLPTYDEDVAHMKTFGIGRERVREMRKLFPKIPRGVHRRRGPG